MTNHPHTPGPWRIADHMQDDAVLMKEGDKGYLFWSRYISTEDGTTIAKLQADLPFGGKTFAFRNVETPQEMTANMRLICAAPDLLAALTAAVAAESERDEPVPGWVAAAVEAIAKAEGAD